MKGEAGSTAETSTGIDPHVFDELTGMENMRQLVQLRWIAVVGQIVTIGVVHFAFGIQLPLKEMGVVLVCLIAFNIASLFRWQEHHEVTNGELFFALLVDVATLTAQLYLSGGATNPFSFLYLLQVILGAVLLRSWSVWTMVGITAACFIGLTFFYRPLAAPPSYYVDGTLICFGLIAALLVIFITRINRNLRARDTRLADLRERAAEEEHIVRMGLLASGAAHELGTPLSTVCVILGDWRRMKSISTDPQMLEEIDEMEAQVQRCKNIVSGILLSAGEARGDSPVETTIRTFVDDLVREWRETRPVKEFEYANRFGHDLPIVSDSAIKQMVHNVLDNALEASPNWVGLDVAHEGDALKLTITDRGPGFPESMLAQLGKPYQSTKDKPGGGLGLFLVSNVARTLHGSVSAHNRSEGGAIVTLTLPLESIVMEESLADGS
jgi:two-component system sensor histidine kinase RegB